MVGFGYGNGWCLKMERGMVRGKESVGGVG